MINAEECKSDDCAVAIKVFICHRGWMFRHSKQSKGTDITPAIVSLRTDITTRIQLQGLHSPVVYEYLLWFSSEQLFFLRTAIQQAGHSLY